MECELIECLVQMDDPLVKADHFAFMKKVRFMDRWMQRIEDDVIEILKRLGGESILTDGRRRNCSSLFERRLSQQTFYSSNKVDVSLTEPADGMRNEELMNFGLDIDPEFENMVCILFERYDFDNSGMINSVEELVQLLLNLVYKFGIKLFIIEANAVSGEWSTWAQDTIKDLIHQRGMSVDEEYSLTVEEYMPLFRSAFYGTK